MAQQGRIIKRHGAWYVRLSEKIMQDGVAKRKQHWKWLHNLANRVIKQRFKEKFIAWKGWRAYLRLTTNLHAPGVDDKTIQAILPHEDVSTTQRSYIITPPQIVTNALANLEAQIRPCVKLGKQTGVSSVVN